MSLKCQVCQESQPFSESPQWWIYECGHAKCSTHAEPLCCGQANYVCNMLEDEVFYATCQYMRYLHPRSQGLGDTYAVAYSALMQVLAREIEGKMKTVQTATQWTCPQCHQALPCTQQTCPTCPEANIFKSLTTLSLNPAMKSLPWVCPKPSCGTKCAPTDTTCVCGFVNLQRVELKPDVEESVVVKRSPVEAQTGNSEVWTCPLCKYEYNYRQEAKCQKCDYELPHDRGSCGLM